MVATGIKKNTEVNNSDLGTVTGSAACHQVDGRKPQGEWPAEQERYQLCSSGRTLKPHWDSPIRQRKYYAYHRLRENKGVCMGREEEDAH